MEFLNSPSGEARPSGQPLQVRDHFQHGTGSEEEGSNHRLVFQRVEGAGAVSPQWCNCGSEDLSAALSLKPQPVR